MKSYLFFMTANRKTKGEREIEKRESRWMERNHSRGWNEISMQSAVARVGEQMRREKHKIKESKTFFNILSHKRHFSASVRHLDQYRTIQSHQGSSQWMIELYCRAS